MVLRGWQFLTSRPTVEGEYLSILPSPLIWLLSHTMWYGERGICMDKKEIDGQGKENTWPLLLVRGPGGHFYPDPDPDDAPLP